MATANYVLLEKIVVGAAGASSVTFNSIPQTGYSDLVVKMSVRDTAANGTVYPNYNGSGSSYSSIRLTGQGTAVSSSSIASLYFAMTGTNETASTFASAELYIPNYTSGNYKSSNVDFAPENYGSTLNNEYMGISASLWSNSGAITSIGFAANTAFAQYSSFYLYGVAKLGTTPAIVPYATGGDTIMTDGTYWYHAFTSSGTFTPTKGLSCDVLTVAGGGGGARSGGSNYYNAGGGGAGGVVYLTSQSLSTSAQTVLVGAGGIGGADSPSASYEATNGNNSSLGSLTAAVGGGRGGVGDGTAGSNGGSGGGGSYNGSGGSGTSGQGTSGGTGANSSAGGGGGAASAGGTGGTSKGGGATNTYSSLLSVVQLGVSGYIAGGGGGGYNTTVYTPSGGNAGGGGGAGNGGVSNTNNPYGTSGTFATSATQNTGSGGGGAPGTFNYSNGGQNGGSGGSGLVIVRYAV